MALDAIKFHLFFKSLHLFIYFLSYFTHIWEQEEWFEIIVTVCFWNNSGAITVS
jgi:hypothetical protein